MVICMDCGRLLSRIGGDGVEEADPYDCPDCNPEILGDEEEEPIERNNDPDPSEIDGDREQVDQEARLWPWLDADTGE